MATSSTPGQDGWAASDDAAPGQDGWAHPLPDQQGPDQAGPGPDAWAEGAPDAAGQGSPELGADDVEPQETDNGMKAGDGDIVDQGSVILPGPTHHTRSGTTVNASTILQTAAGHLGTIENPVGSNKQPFGAAYGMNGVAWCNIFVSRMGYEAHGDYGLLGKFAWTPACATWWKDHGRFGHEPRSGAVVFFDWNGSKSIQAIDHVGIVVEPLANGLVRTIEGNSAVPGHTDGVWYHDRNPKFIVGYGYPQYCGPTPTPIIPEDDFHTYEHVDAGSREVAVLDCGDDVKVLQTILHLDVDGEFGARTKNAVLAYQKANGLEVDGVVGPITWAALLTPPVPPPFPGTLILGSTGADVRAAQQRLQDRGWTIEVDGDFGSETQSVVRAFQEDKSLDVNGEVGPETWAALWGAAVTPA